MFIGGIMCNSVLHQAIRVAVISLSIQSVCSFAAVTTPAGVDSSTGGVTVDIAEVFPDGIISTSTENPLQTGVGAASGGLITWSGESLQISADRFGFFSDGSGSQIEIGNTTSKIDLTVDYVPANKWASAENYGFRAENGGTINVTADELSVEVSRAKERLTAAVSAKELGSSIALNADTLWIEASNMNSSISTEARGVEASAGGEVLLGGTGASLISISSAIGTSSEGNNSGREANIINATSESFISVDAAEIILSSSGYNTRGIYADAGKVSIGNLDSEVSITSKGTASVVAVKVNNPDGSVSIKAANLEISAVSSESQGVALMATSNTQTEVRPENSASITIDADHTHISANSVGISANSNSTVNVHGGLRIDAPVAIEARGHSLVDIGGEGPVAINGNVSFATAAKDSGNVLDADIRLNLTGADSVWNGNVQLDYPDSLEGLDKTIDQGVTLSLSDHAQWNPTVIQEGVSDQGNEIETQALNLLNLDGGIVNVRDTDQVVEVTTIAGSGGTINVAAAVSEGGGISAGQFTVKNASGDQRVTLAVQYEDINADDLTEMNVASLSAVTGDAVADMAVTEHVEEGNIRGAWTRTNGEGAGSYADNTKLESFRGVNAVALVQWRNQINHLTKRLGDVRHQKGDIGAWARVYGGEYEWGDANRVDMQTTTVQVGGDARLGDWIVGGAFSYSDSSYDLDNGDGDGDMYSLAVYGTRTFEKGSYVDFVARYGYIKNDIKAGNMGVDFDSNAFSLSVEGGHTFKLMERAYVEPQIEVTYGFAQGDDATASNGVKIEQDDYQNLITRIGFRTGFDFPNEAGTIYAHAGYSYDFLGEADGTASQNGLRASLDEDLGGGWVTYGIGGQFRLGESTFAYGELERSTGGDVDNPWAFNVGLRHLF